jgi:RNA polymerase sigma-70 factor (ECF subfamily)
MSSGKLETPFPLVLSEAQVEGDPRAAAQEVLCLFDEHAPRLRRYLTSFDFAAAASEDILQETFLSLHRHLLLGRSRHNLRAWLFQVGHNLALRHRYRTVRRLTKETAWDAALVERLVDPAENPEERLTEARRRERLMAVARALPQRDRQCLVLRADGMGYRDIAATLGISLGSVAKSLARAIARLADADTGACR